jgi:hypothetical protein
MFETHVDLPCFLVRNACERYIKRIKKLSEESIEGAINDYINKPVKRFPWSKPHFPDREEVIHRLKSGKYGYGNTWWDYEYLPRQSIERLLSAIETLPDGVRIRVSIDDMETIKYDLK